MTGNDEAGLPAFDVVVSVGTDHHPFDRLVQWIDQWAALHADVSVYMQWGTSSESERVEGADIVAHGELLRLFAAAEVIVSHGGPSTVMDARSSGRLPIVVPRDPARGEHVDGHQMRFADHLELHGLARVATDQAQFFEALDKIAADPSLVVNDEPASTLPAGIVRFASVVDDLLGTTTPLTES